MSEPLQPHHRLAMDARLGSLHLQINLQLFAPWTVIFGPSGSGKSSILRAICSLMPRAQVDLARAEVGGWEVLDGQRHSMAPNLRSIAYAPQGAVLFAHLNVKENIAFASRVRGTKQEETVKQAIEMFDLRGLASRMPHDLSGGERQRVNLARAFAVPQPRLMLLDEPFTGIDRGLRNQLLPQMQDWLARLRVPVISVTHDIEETFMLNAEVLRLVAGKVVAQGPAAQLLALERSQMLQILQSDD